MAVEWSSPLAAQRRQELPPKNRLVKFSSDNTFEIHSVAGGYD